MRITERKAEKILCKIDRIALIKDDPKTAQGRPPKIAAMFREATTAPKGTNQHTDNVSTLKPEHGTSRAYTLARLKRERPDLFDRVAD
jgi:hypothetical protein